MRSSLLEREGFILSEEDMYSGHKWERQLQGNSQ